MPNYIAFVLALGLLTAGGSAARGVDPKPETKTATPAAKPEKPDAESLFAFKLSDGTQAWKIKRGDGVYVAGLYDGMAIVVDSDAVRAVNAADGKEAWKVSLQGTLTGYGAFDKDRFLQPLGLGEEAREGILQVIDLKQGKAGGTIQRTDKKEFGNLIIHKGKLVSQTLESLSAYDIP